MEQKHIDFIKKDLKERGEVPVSDVTFLGALYFFKVKKEGSKRARSVTYSAAKTLLRWYRPISV